MMKFDCPHCGQQLVHQEEVAGREGWCRFCKGIIVMPQPGQPSSLPNLSPDQRFAQLVRMFRFAATIVDEHRQLQASLRNGEQALAQEIRMRNEAQRSAEMLRHELTRTMAMQSEKEAEYKRVTSELEASKSEHAAFMTETEKRLAQAKNELQKSENRDDVLLGRVLAIEQDINRAERIAKESFDDECRKREELERTLRSTRTALAEAEEAEAALKVKVEEADARTTSLEAELAETRSAKDDLQLQFDEECKRLTTLYTAERDQRSQLEQSATESGENSERVSALETELAEARAALESAHERHDAQAERIADLEQSLQQAEERNNKAHEEWEEQRRQLSDEVDHYRKVLQKVDQDLEEIETKRQTNEAKLQSQLDEKRLELLRETTQRVKSQRLHDEASKELAASKIALAAAEDNLRLLKNSTNSLREELGTVLPSSKAM